MTFKQILIAAFDRIELIEHICFSSQSLSAIADTEDIELKIKQMTLKQKQLVDKLMIAKRTGDNKFNCEFQSFSESVFTHWESGFAGNCIGKGRLSEIIQLHIRFYSFIREKEVVNYLSQMILSSKSDSSTIFVLLNCLFRVLGQMTDKAFSSLKSKLKEQINKPQRHLKLSQFQKLFHSKIINNQSQINSPVLNTNLIKKQRYNFSKQNNQRRPLSVRINISRKSSRQISPSPKKQSQNQSNFFETQQNALILELQPGSAKLRRKSLNHQAQSQVKLQQTLKQMMYRNQMQNQSIISYTKDFRSRKFTI